MSAKHRKHRRQNDSASMDSELDFMDDTFSFIAGYTSWGYPYGTTWQESGIDPALPFEEKKRLYEAGEYAASSTAFPELTPARLAELRKILATLESVHTKLLNIGAESGNDDLLDAADHIDAAIDNIGVWAKIGSDEYSDDTVKQVKTPCSDTTVAEIDDEELPF